jgi:hypothetical protein
VLITAIFQTVLRISDSRVGADPDRLSILLCAPTGKAAFNIKGQTLQMAFQLPINSKDITDLSANVANN